MASSTAGAFSIAMSAPKVDPNTSPDDVDAKLHHDAGSKSFHNPWPSFSNASTYQMLRGILVSRLTTSGWDLPTGPTVPVRTPTFLPTRETRSLRATWLGHASYYIEFPSGLRVLFDPVFTCRCSPFSFLGPKRYTDMPCTIADLPFIDAVVISHSHYDHLSLPTIREIQRLHPNAQFLAPLGNKKWFESCGIKNSHELDWWEETHLKLTLDDPSSQISNPIEAVFTCLPSQHTSGRTPFNRNATLWSSWSVSSGSKVYFAGDTGYRSVPDQKPPDEETSDYDLSDARYPHCPAFKQIGALKGPFDLGLIPIGAYSPRFIMSPLHANPFDAVNILADTRCKVALGMHFGTWVLTNEPPLEPIELLRKALKGKGISEERFGVVDIGESREIY